MVKVGSNAGQGQKSIFIGIIDEILKIIVNGRISLFHQCVQITLNTPSILRLKGLSDNPFTQFFQIRRFLVPDPVESFLTVVDFVGNCTGIYVNDCIFRLQECVQDLWIAVIEEYPYRYRNQPLLGGLVGKVGKPFLGDHEPVPFPAHINDGKSRLLNPVLHHFAHRH